MSYVLRKGHSILSDLADGAGVRLGAGYNKIYYVNGVTWSNGFAAGDDGNDGLTIDEPLHTITKALSLCTNEGNDAIVLLDYWAATGETWPIAVSKSLVSIFGIQHKYMQGWIWLYSASDVCMDITGKNVYIEGLNFYPAATKACVTMDDGAQRVWLNKCGFHVGTCGVDLDADDTSSGIEITNCFFSASLSAGGIDVDDDPAFMNIAGNHFDRLTGDCINISAGAGHRIVDNTFALKANTQGLAITLQTGVSRALVTRNHASYGTASTTSPYDDEGTVTTNSWGLNYLGKTAIDPA